ncbi:MAG: glycosyltransferase, partial [Lachnospiraceae bacterium]|nr:glycosyltransferase [Lachnospiraceae bacterium]
MKISFVIPCYRSEKTLSDVVDEIKTTMAEIGHEFEIILVNDCSPDKTFELIKKLEEENDNIL